MKFDFTVLTVQQLNSYLSQCQSSNWMQSWAYAKASHVRDYKSIRPAVIKYNNDPVGLMLIHEIKLGPIHFVDLKRGPLWFKNAMNQFQPELLFIEFAKKFDETYPSGLFKRRRWLPEFEFSNKTIYELEQIGFKKRVETFSTIYVDLSLDETILRANLKQKWRNCLNKSEKQNLSVKIENDLKSTDLFLNKYIEYKSFKKFSGPTAKFIKEEMVIAYAFKQLHIAWAYLNNEPIAGILITTHGESASYRIGWNSNLGKKTNAHYLLIWTMLLKLKKLGFKSFDLGGILPGEQDSLTHFKCGLGHKPTQFIGIFE